jgi:antitoxin component YwqK of YwqJK toxin-antitoxin module
MKRILAPMLLAPILLLTLLFSSLAFGEQYDDLVKRDGIFYKKFSTVPFTGKTTGKTQGTFRNGKEHGPWVRYHKNGQLEYKGTYEDGKLDGPWVFYWKDGQLLSKGTYTDGKRDGPWVFYNSNRTINVNSTGTFKDGVKVK